MAKEMSRAEIKHDLRALVAPDRRVDGSPRFRSDPPLLVPAEELLDGASGSGNERRRGGAAQLPREPAADRRPLYELYRYADMARKVVGVGSVGTRAWVLLFFGRDDDDPLFLQVKEAQASVLEPFLGRSRFRHAGRRVVEGQRLMQAASDMLLGWYHVTGFDGKPLRLLRTPALGRQGLVRRRGDGPGAGRATRSSAPGRSPGPRPLGRPHRDRGVPGHRRRFDRAIADFAEAYADQNQRDYEALRAAVDAGRLVKAQTGI